MSYYSIILPRIGLRNQPSIFELPKKIMEEELEFKGGMCPVVCKSKKIYRVAVWKIAQLFRREFEYDFTQYGSEGAEDDELSRAYLWWSQDNEAIGACCFRWREYSDHAPGWGLQWIWFHPYERRKGHLSRSWPYFKQRFKDFQVESPISTAMGNFMVKHQ